MESSQRNPGDGNGFDGAVNKAASSVHGAVDKMAGSADDAVRNVKPVVDRVAQAAHQVVNKAVDAAVPAADWVREQGNSLKAAQQQATVGAENYVAAHPWKVIAVVLAAGFVIGRLFWAMPKPQLPRQLP